MLFSFIVCMLKKVYYYYYRVEDKDLELPVLNMNMNKRIILSFMNSH